MSILKTQRFLEHKGCTWGFGILSLLVLGVGFIMGGFGRMFGAGMRRELNIPIVKVGSFGSTPICAASISTMASKLASVSGANSELAVEKLRASMAINMGAKGAFSPMVEQQVASWVIAILQAKTDAQVVEFGVKIGLAPKPDEVLKALSAGVAGASNQDAAQQYLEDLQSQLDNPNLRNEPFAEYIRSTFIQREVQQTTITDDDLRKSFNTYAVKRLAFPDGAAGKAAADKALADLKSGQSIDTVGTHLPKSSGTAAAPKYFPADRVSGAAADPEAAVLGKLKTGEHTDVVKTDSGYAIDQLVSSQGQVPADFAANVAQYRSNYLRQAAATKLGSQMASQAPGDASWEKKTYPDLINLFQAIARGQYDKKALLGWMADFKAELNDQDVDRAASLGYYCTVRLLAAASSPEERAKMGSQIVEASETVLNGFEDVDIRIQLAGIYADMKDGAKASAALKIAADDNADSLGPDGQARAKSIEALVAKLEAAKLLDAKSSQDIGASVALFKKNVADKLAYDKQQAADEAASRRQSEEIEKKFKAGQKGGSASPATPPTPAPIPSGKP